jgi:hypothetical protein
MVRSDGARRTELDAGTDGWLPVRYTPQPTMTNATTITMTGVLRLNFIRERNTAGHPTERELPQYQSSARYGEA